MVSGCYMCCLVFRWVSFRRDDGLAAARHAVDEIHEVVASHCLPTCLENGKRLVFILWFTSAAMVVQNVPQMLDWIGVRRLARPREDCQSVVGFFAFEVSCDDFCCVFRVVVLLKNKPTTQKTYTRRDGVVNENLLILLFNKNALVADK